MVLRPWRATSSDAEALAAAWADPTVARWTAVPARAGVDDAARWIAGAGRRLQGGIAVDLVVSTRSDEADVRGEVGLVVVDRPSRRVEVGYWTAEPHRGRGQAATALDLLTTWAIDVGGARLCFAHTHPDNPASARTARAAGYEHRGDLADGTRIWART